MSPDAHANFAYSTVLTAPSPATSGTSIVLASGGGLLLPSTPFNITIWPSNANPRSSNAEIARVTALSGDTLTITRAQEGTSARTVLVGDSVAATITAKTLTDLENPTQTYFRDEPIILDDPSLYVLNAGVLWLDATERSVNIATMDYEPNTDWLVWPGSTTHFDDDPLLLDSPVLFEIAGNSATLLWLDAARCPQTISTLLIIGV